MNIGLIRVSSIGQKDNTSLSNQKKMINEYCSIYSIELDEIIEEIYTGTTSDRDGLNHLKSLIENGDVESVVVMKLDRLMRSFSEGVVFIKYLLDNDVKIISVLEKIDTSTTSGRFFMNVLLSLNEMERDTIVERMNTGKIRKFEDHERISGSICYGYNKSKNGLIVDKEESKIIHYIYKRYLELRKRDLSKTKTMRELRKSLKKRNYKYKDHEFTSPTINYILSNSFYTGVMTHGNKTNKHKYDTIISSRLFNLINN
jgi:DNA invertase Pin-like site-specific DNA recombinase